MKLKTDICHLLLNTQDKNILKIRNFDIKIPFLKSYLGITFDRKLKFSNRIQLTWIFLVEEILKNAFFRSQFNYCSLIWMCYNRSLNHEINLLHERCLRTIYSDTKSSFDEWLDKDKYFSIRHESI